MTRLFFFLILFPVLANSQVNNQRFKISGKLKNAPEDLEWIFLSYAVNGERKTDSVKLVNGRYQLKGEISEPTLASLRVKYAEKPDGSVMALDVKRDVTGVFLEKGKIKLQSKDSISNINVKKSEVHSEYVKLNKILKPYNEKMQVLYARYSVARKNNDKDGQKKIENEMDALSAEIDENVYGKYAKENLNSSLIMYAVKQFAGWDINPAKVEPVFNSLPADVQQWPSAIRLREQIEIAKRTGIGRYAMDFTQNDTSGAPVTLSSFRGKWMLIDFWASWCGPCRAENPNVVKAYQKYREQGFHIIGVSLDRPGQKEKWLKAIHDDQLEWTHVSDLKYWQNDVAVMYGIQAIPQNLLLNPEGKIIAKNLRGEELDKKLEELIVESKKAF